MKFTTYTSASVLAALAAAQTFTQCNPMQKTCPNNPAMPQTWETDFTKGKDGAQGWQATTGSLNFNGEGATFSVGKKGDGPTIQSGSYFHFGYTEVVMKAAPGAGIVSSIVLESDNLDEVDWEWIGSVDSQVQMNYFGKGNTTTYDRMIQANVAQNQQGFHKYALNWTAESLTWLVDDKPMRTLRYADAVGGKNYPQTPCNIRLGNWAGGDSDNEGTRQWAGGRPDYSKGPFIMTVKSVKVINYSPGKEYQFTDMSGDYKSIKVIEPGNTNGAPVQAFAPGTGIPIASGAAPSVTSKLDGKPCSCGIGAAIVTGNPPTTISTNIPVCNSSVTLSAIGKPVASGIVIDTHSAPYVPTTPTAPVSNSPTTPKPTFTGAASHNAVGYLAGAVAGAFMLAL